MSRQSCNKLGIKVASQISEAEQGAVWWSAGLPKVGMLKELQWAVGQPGELGREGH